MVINDANDMFSDTNLAPKTPLMAKHSQIAKDLLASLLQPLTVNIPWPSQVVELEKAKEDANL